MAQVHPSADFVRGKIRSRAKCICFLPTQGLMWYTSGIKFRFWTFGWHFVHLSRAEDMIVMHHLWKRKPQAIHEKDKTREEKQQQQKKKEKERGGREINDKGREKEEETR